MQTEIILIRHGTTAWNKDKKFQGTKDIELNEDGIREAERLQDYFRNHSLDKIYTSDLKRASVTAETISVPHNLEVIPKNKLRELNFGLWEGLTYSEIRQKNPELSRKWFSDPTSVTIPEGEDMKSFSQRLRDCFNNIIKNNKNRKIMVVTHGGVIRVWLSILLDISLKTNWKLAIDNGSISIVHFFDKSPVIKLLNYNVNA